MEVSERNLLLDHTKSKSTVAQLSVIFAIICIVDVFGVFPVIALPKAIIDCGVYGILIVVVVCLIQIYTAILLGKCWNIAEKIDITMKRKNRYPYSALAEVTYGSRFSNCVSFLLNLAIFCGGIPNLIVASQNLQFLGLRLSDNTLNVSFCFWIIAIGMILCPILWLGSPKDMKLLCSVSVSIVFLVFFLLVFGCLVFTHPEAVSEDTFDNFSSERPLWEVLLIAYGIISFQYDIHPSVLTIQVDMKDKSKINVAVIGGFTISLGMFCIVTGISAIKYGQSTQPSLLETLPSNMFLHLAVLFVAVQLCLSLAVSNSALFQHMEDCMRIPRAFNHRRCVLRTTLILVAILIAESVPRFDLVMSLIGGALTGPLVFTLPPMFYLKMLSLQKRYKEQKALDMAQVTVNGDEEQGTRYLSFPETERTSLRRKVEICCCIFIVIFSFVATVMTTYVNVKNAAEFSNFTEPCIFNVSAALIDL